MKKLIIWLVVIVLVVLGIYLLIKSTPGGVEVTPGGTTSTTTPATGETATTTAANPGQTTIGQSVQGRDIVAYHFGTGNQEILFVGGIHGGYEWNTVLVAQQLVNYLTANPGAVPTNEKVTVIPVLNPDGLYQTVGTTTGNFTAAAVPASPDTQIAGRFNADKVDLNRNFDCDWQATGVWQSQPVSGGSAAFSEPESQAMKNYITTNQPAAVVTWYSAAGGVYASSCHNGVSPETNKLAQIYAAASGYQAHESFDFYATTGDMVNWLAKANIPAISVLLTNHTDTEWTKNQAGVLAVLKSYAK